ncbi:hypothetical protein VB779_12890 [Haloarculaceae archaeon H-GB11]|nr:hypothetical protein [Haloarculaceae archaeon H-GB11]
MSVNGTDVTDHEPHEIVGEGMVRTFQTPRKPEGMSVREAMLVGPQGQTGESILPLFTSSSTVRQEERQSLERAEEMLERFEIADLATQSATDLSGDR